MVSAAHGLFFFDPCIQRPPSLAALPAEATADGLALLTVALWYSAALDSLHACRCQLQASRERTAMRAVFFI